MNQIPHFIITIAVTISSTLFPIVSDAALNLARTRIIFDGNEKSLSLPVDNENHAQPYLAQSWIEDANGKKIDSPLIALPPIQRIEADSSIQIKIQGRPDLSKLPQDRETIFYFNLREIPPKNKKPNTLNIALQTRLKLFYRPASIIAKSPNDIDNWLKKITLQCKEDECMIVNPMPYYLMLLEMHSSTKKIDFTPALVSPKSHLNLKTKSDEWGQTPELVYIDDRGEQKVIYLHCGDNLCTVENLK